MNAPIPHGFESEVAFWDDYLAARPRGIADRAERERAFPRELRAYLESERARTGGKPAIIEVGPGPVSLLAWGVEARLMDLAAVDPLADAYAAMLERYGIAYPVRPQAGCGEDLLEGFAPGSFDAAYASNSLDHTRAPRRVLENLRALVRPGGRIVLEGFRREGTNAGWEGLHQHDLVPCEGQLLHFDRERRLTNLTKGLGLRCLVERVTPFEERGIDSFGYESDRDGTVEGWYYFDWFTLVYEVPPEELPR